MGYFPNNFFPTNFMPTNYWPPLEEIVQVVRQPRESQGGGAYYYKPINSIFDNEEDKPTVEVDKESEEVIILKMISMLDAIKEKPRKKKAIAENDERQIIELIDKLASMKTHSFNEEDDIESILHIISAV